MQGEKYTPKGEQITEYPAEFKKWVKAHKADIAKARSRGTEPYFIRNNAYAIDGILNPKQKELTTLEKAKLRHDARTPEQIQAIQQRWDERRHKNELVITTANNVLKVTKDYGEVDFSALQELAKGNNLAAIKAETKAIAKRVSEVKKQEKTLSDLIPDAHGWHKQFTMEELQAVHVAVLKKLTEWNALSIENRVRKMKFEAIDYLGGNMRGVQQKYQTWEVSQVAYLKALRETSEKWMLDLIMQGDIYYASTASDLYAEAILAISTKKYSKQQSVLSASREKKAMQNLKKYLTEPPINPHHIWGDYIGGKYNSMLSERKSLAAELKGVTADDLTLVTRFTSGMTFYNAYNLRTKSAYWRKVWNDKMNGLSSAEIADCERIIQEYTLALDGIINKMKRYEGVVYRGIHSSGGAELLKQFQSAWKSKNKTWVNNAAASSSTDIRISYYQFDDRGADDLIMVIKNKSGAYIRPISEYNGEKEVLLMKDIKYKLLKAPYQINNKWFVELEEI